MRSKRFLSPDFLFSPCRVDYHSLFRQRLSKRDHYPTYPAAKSGRCSGCITRNIKGRQVDKNRPVSAFFSGAPTGG